MKGNIHKMKKKNGMNRETENEKRRRLFALQQIILLTTIFHKLYDDLFTDEHLFLGGCCSLCKQTLYSGQFYCERFHFPSFFLIARHSRPQRFHPSL